MSVGEGIRLSLMLHAAMKELELHEFNLRSLLARLSSGTVKSRDKEWVNRMAGQVKEARSRIKAVEQAIHELSVKNTPEPV